MTSPTEKNIARVLELSEKATPGPWTVQPQRDSVLFYRWYPRLTSPAADHKYAEASCEFIAHARTAMPLLARQLKVALEALQAVHCNDQCAVGSDVTAIEAHTGCEKVGALKALASIDSMNQGVGDGST